ncbi:ComEC/Rec2 family competence protein [Sphingomonas abietis]|uniref:MBL fold metallo-hydrolase n=1 Tax=Sphingomonas abietis TaxID=3012344 RepID=A0ABY7NRD6_9SPHN|nr:hypothetical protein [Sphingomonas abietis]WBO22514.1 hypothetical protein PBT88_20665 [Sphingomonas abietis]
MIDAGLKDQQIHAFFSQPGRDFNHNRISALRNGDRSQMPAPASAAELQDFLDHWAAPSGLPRRWFIDHRDAIDPNWWSVTYRFHPVGQGMLHSGELRHGRRRQFTWIYDCGSVTSEKLVESELDDLWKARNVPVDTRPPLDFVALSHFDSDHVSGIVHLLGLFDVKMILLPFMPLWQRIWIAASADDLDADFLQFLIDPAGYLIEASGGATRIVFVPPSDGDPPPAPEDGLPEEGPEEGPRGAIDDRPMKLRLETEHAPDIVEGEIPGVTGQRLSEAEFLKAESVLDIDGLWEFVPYNDARQARKCPADFPARVDPLIAALLAAKKEVDRETAFADLKALYDTTFRGDAYNRNIISLFLYGGPVPTPADADFETGHTWPGYPYWYYAPDLTRLSPEHFSMLFTGDGSLNSKPRRTAFSDFFRPYGRLDKTSVFQVMHLGAKGNSSPEVAALVEPRASIFCSDPSKGEKHPDAEVLRQFWSYNCIQVDDALGWMMTGIFEF